MSSTASPLPPVCKKVAYSHEYHGKKFQDDYHWLKDMNPKEKKAEIIDYVKAENEFTKTVHLDKNEKLIDSIYQEIISRINEDDQDVPVFHGGYYYYSRTVKGSQYALHCRKKGSMEAEEQILLDLNKRSEEYIDLRALKVSPDHKMIAYSLDFEGSEKYKIYFQDIDSGKMHDSDTIIECSGSICWAADSKHVWYSTLDQVQRPYKVFRHLLGSTAADELVYHEKDPKFFVGMALSLSKEYLFVQSESSLTSEVSFLKTSTPTSPLQLFQERQVGHRYDVEHQGSSFLIRTNGKQEFLNYRLCSSPLTDTSKWTEVIPYNPYVEIEEVVPFKDFIVVSERSEGTVKLRVLPSQNGVLHGGPSSTHYIDIKEALYSAYMNSYHEQDYNKSVVRFSYSTPISDKKVIEYNLGSKEQKVLKFKEVPGDFDPSLYTLQRIYAPIAKEDQVAAPFNTPVSDKVPISLFYKTSLFKGDGSNPCYLYGYGSYGISIDAGWSASKISLLDRGFVFAIGHIRGGGDNGRAWYETGKFKNKKNTFIDFQSCAKTLIAKKYTNPKVLAIDGRSAGGMLIGSTLNLDPSLYAVAVAGVPFVDVINTMMDETIPLTINEYEGIFFVFTFSLSREVF